MEKCTLLWCEAKMVRAHHIRNTFGSCDVEKVHAVVARRHFEVKSVNICRVRSTFGSCDVEKNARRCGAKHISLWKLRCGKSAHHCGAKHISKSKVLKTDSLGPLLEVKTVS